MHTDNLIILDHHRSRPRRWSPSQLAAESFEIGEAVTVRHDGRRVRAVVEAVTLARGEGWLHVRLIQGARRGLRLTVDALDADPAGTGS